MQEVDLEELARETLPAVPESVRAARALVASVLDGRTSPDLHDAALIVISELSANAMLHAGTPFEVVVCAGAGDIRLEVHDRQPRLPRRKHYSDEATTGRGLVLVEALSSLAGAERTEHGKVVWAILSDLPPAPPVVGDGTGESDTMSGLAVETMVSEGGRDVAEVRVAAQDDTWDLRAQLWALEHEVVPA